MMKERKPLCCTHTYNLKETGITLIALVVTIIVLLILAGVTLSIALSNEGIINRSKDAKTQKVIGDEKDSIQLAYASAKINKIGDKVTSEDLQNELDESVGKNQTIVTGNVRLKIRFINTGNEYTILDDGGVEKYKKVNPTNVYATVCSNGALVFSNNEDDINKYINDNHISIAERYTIENITNKQYDGTETYDESIDDTIWNNPTWWQSLSVTKAIILNEIAPTSTAYWFADLFNLETIEDIENLNTSNVTNMRCMFSNVYSLRELDVSGFDTSSCTDMSFMFNLYDGENDVTVLDVSGFDTSNVISMEGMFMGWSEISNLDVSNFNTSKVTNMSKMFNGLYYIRDMDLRNFDTSKVTDMSEMFNSCRSIENLDLSSFNTSNVTNMNYMFTYCDYNLTTLDLSSFDTSKVTGMEKLFYSCRKLKTVYVGNKWNTNNVNESYKMFYECDLIEGECGTKYNYNAGLSYAHVDGGTSNPGYFSSKHN